MMEETPPQSGRTPSTNEFNNRARARQSGNGMSGTLLAGPAPEYKEPSAFADIGNFFRVLLAFISGLWNRDFSEFDLLSSVYFPPPKPGTEAAPRTAEEQNVDRMRAMRTNPDDPNYFDPATGRRLSPREVLDRVSHGVARPSNFEDIITIFMPFEGGMNRNEPFGAIANYGINSRAHPGIDVEKLTREKAVEIYRTEYWNKLQWPGGDMSKMSGAVKLIAFDAAANSGLPFANRLLRESFEAAGGDVTKMPEIMLAKRRAHYASLIANNPGEYAKYKDGWESRMRTIEGLIARWDMVTPVNQLYVIAPVNVANYPVSDDHGVREKHPVTGQRSLHRGTDYRVPYGTSLLATYGGTVVSTKTHSGYGNTVVIAHGNGIYEMYAHLSRAHVKPGDVLNRGQVIAYSGNTGTGTGAHLHHEMWIERGGVIYTIDEVKAKGQNIKDPAVQDMLIRDAMSGSGSFSPASTITNDIPAQFRAQISALTERDQLSAQTSGSTAPNPTTASTPQRPS